MQAVILAAGRGTRLRPLTNETPKLLLEMGGGKTTGDIFLDNLPSEVTEIIFVINHFGDKIKSHFGDEKAGRKINYIFHELLDGTAKALWTCQEKLEDDFIVLYGDDIYGASDLKKLISHPLAILVVERDGVPCGGQVTLNEEGFLSDIRDYPEEKFTHYYLHTGAYKLNRKIFDYEPVLINDKSDEYGLPQTLSCMAKDFDISVVKAEDYWQINTIEDLEKARENFKLKVSEEKGHS